MHRGQTSSDVPTDICYVHTCSRSAFQDVFEVLIFGWCYVPVLEKDISK